MRYENRDLYGTIHKLDRVKRQYRKKSTLPDDTVDIDSGSDDNIEPMDISSSEDEDDDRRTQDQSDDVQEFLSSTSSQNLEAYDEENDGEC